MQLLYKSLDSGGVKEVYRFKPVRPLDVDYKIMIYEMRDTVSAYVLSPALSWELLDTKKFTNSNKDRVRADLFKFVVATLN